MFVLVAPVVYAGGFLYSLITGSPIQLGLLKIYNVVIRVPGAKVTEETSLAAGLLMNAFFLVGVFSFAVSGSMGAEGGRQNAGWRCTLGVLGLQAGSGWHTTHPLRRPLLALAGGDWAGERGDPGVPQGGAQRQLPG